MLYVVLGILALFLSLIFTQAVHRPAPNAVPHEVMRPK
jgi:hypothetical protein